MIDRDFVDAGGISRINDSKHGGISQRQRRQTLAVFEPGGQTATDGEVPFVFVISRSLLAVNIFLVVATLNNATSRVETIVLYPEDLSKLQH